MVSPATGPAPGPRKRGTHTSGARRLMPPYIPPKGGRADKLSMFKVTRPYQLMPTSSVADLSQVGLGDDGTYAVG